MADNTSELLRLGRTVDDFVLPTVRGGECALYDLLDERRVFLVFYRGGWCPLCNLQLLELSSSYEEFEAANLEILAISSEEVEKGRKVLNRLGPPYRLLQDLDGEITRRFGLTIDSRDLFSVLLRKRGFPHPGVILVGQDRTIQWSYRGKTYRDRPRASQLLRAARRNPVARTSSSASAAT